MVGVGVEPLHRGAVVAVAVAVDAVVGLPGAGRHTGLVVVAVVPVGPVREVAVVVDVAVVAEAVDLLGVLAQRVRGQRERAVQRRAPVESGAQRALPVVLEDRAREVAHRVAVGGVVDAHPAVLRGVLALGVGGQPVAGVGHELQLGGIAVDAVVAGLAVAAHRQRHRAVEGALLRRVEEQLEGADLRRVVGVELPRAAGLGDRARVEGVAGALGAHEGEAGGAGGSGSGVVGVVGVARVDTIGAPRAPVVVAVEVPVAVVVGAIRALAGVHPFGGRRGGRGVVLGDAAPDEGRERGEQD